ncbi:TonB-dependent receptor [Asticcacaulis sp. W401b]|uniref:TonB-dependent receptor n=1 Tax=Asticcacaulis sp. W401b TaxID=3388666 RepID=UPI0039708795
MKQTFKPLLMASVASLGTLLALAAPQAFAQTAPQPAASADEVTDVVVTARRRAETLKDVPIAVSTFSSAKLDQTGAQDITALQQQAPNMTLQVARGSNSTLIAFIRGVGQQDPLWGFEPGVGLYVDDVYVARPQGAVLDIYDVQRVEVLRGPQGTLYGRNTIGGAIKYVTKPLDMTSPTFMARGSLGSYNQRDLVLTGSIPLTDQFAVGAAIAKYNRDGFGKNLFTGAEHYNKDVTAVRLSAEYNPTDKLSLRLAYDRTQDDSNARHGHRETPALNSVGGPLYTGTQAVWNTPPADPYDTYAGLGDKNKVETDGVSLTAEYKISDTLTFKSISAVRSGETATKIDFDNTPGGFMDVPAKYEDTQATQELQFTYGGERWSWVAGLFYLNSTASGAFDTTILGNAATTLTQGKVRTNSIAAFADFNYKLTDKWSLSFGGRYTKDNKRGTVYRANYAGAPSPVFGGTGAVTLLRSNYSNDKSFDKFTPRVSLSYAFTPALTGYAAVSEGFKSGGFDMRGDVILTPSTVNGYNPETVLSKEIGLKGTTFDGRMNFTLAVFDSKYDDMQITRQTPVGATVASQVENAGKASIRGAEFEGTLRFTDKLTGNFALGYTGADFDEFISYNVLTASYVNLAGVYNFQMTPEWTNNFGLTYKTDAFGGSLVVSPQASYRSDMQMFEAANAALDQKAYWLYDMGVTWTAPGAKYKVGLYGRNLGDERYRTGGYNFPSSVSPLFGNSVSAFYGAPRTVTLTLEYRY